MKFGDMAHGQNNDSFHQPTRLMLENTLVLFTAKSLDSSNTLENVCFWKRKTYAISWLYYNFSAIFYAICKSNENGRFSTQFWRLN